MSLDLQIISSIFSFLYGILFSILLNFNYNVLFSGKRLFRIFSNILFLLDSSLLYFILIKRINEGIIHPYFYLLFFLGACLCFSKTKFLRRFIKKWPIIDVKKSKGKSK